MVRAIAVGPGVQKLSEMAQLIVSPGKVATPAIRRQGLSNEFSVFVGTTGARVMFAVDSVPLDTAFDSGKIDKDKFMQYSETEKILMDFSKAGIYRIQAQAMKDDLVDSEIATYELKVPKLSPPQITRCVTFVKLETEEVDGAYITIYYTVGGKDPVPGAVGCNVYDSSKRYTTE